jgi:hypothetical protein
MGGTVMAAEDTAAILQQAAHDGVPAMIPGAFEIRAGRPTDVTSEWATSHVRPPTLGDRERLEREREGGGAPGERRAGRHRTILARLWHGLFHPADLLMIWRHPLPREQ